MYLNRPKWITRTWNDEMKSMRQIKGVQEASSPAPNPWVSSSAYNAIMAINKVKNMNQDFLIVKYAVLRLISHISPISEIISNKFHSYR